jgi:poly(A) polymerase
MDHLGIAPGRAVGEALKFLLAIKRSEGDLETDELLRRLDGWWAERA